MDLEELENKLSGLAEKVEDLEQEKQDRELDNFQLKFPLDDESTKVIEDTISNRILDIVWEDYLYYPEFFNSTESLSISTSLSAGVEFVNIPQPYFRLFTDNQNTSSVLVGKYIFGNTLALSLDREQRIKGVFKIPVSAAEVEFSGGDRSYGFKISDGVLKGFVDDDGSSITTLALQTLSNQSYKFEARFYPREQVLFFLDDVQVASLTVPSSLNGAMAGIWNLRLETTNTTAKTIDVDIIEFIQRRI